jgi:hypothetical protein
LRRRCLQRRALRVSHTSMPTVGSSARDTAEQSTSIRSIACSISRLAAVVNSARAAKSRFSGTKSRSVMTKNPSRCCACRSCSDVGTSRRPDRAARARTRPVTVVRTATVEANGSDRGV